MPGRERSQQIICRLMEAGDLLAQKGLIPGLWCELGRAFREQHVWIHVPTWPGGRAPRP